MAETRMESRSRSLSDFTVDLDVYSGPYEWLLALIMRDEVEIFEVPLRELVALYLGNRDAGRRDTLERDTDFAGSAAALVLLKSRTLSPAIEPEGEAGEEEALTPEQLAERLSRYLKIKRGADTLRERLKENAGFHASGHILRARPGRLHVNHERLVGVARRTFSRLTEPPVQHLGPITVTLQDLADLIRSSLTRGPVSYEDLTLGMDRLNAAVAFAAALSLASEGRLALSQPEPLGPLTFVPVEAGQPAS